MATAYEKRDRNNEIAKNILAQLGGGRFIAMTGAYNLCAIDNGLVLRFKGSRKANAIKIILNGLDLYDITFLKQGRAPSFEVKTVAEHSNVYNDMLQDLFTSETGLYTSL